MLRIFQCVDGCSDCCINREYYPSIEYGKIGVLLLPKEKPLIEKAARESKTKIRILPRIGISTADRGEGPEQILAYQLMGHSPNGDCCPFLNLSSHERSPHGGFLCNIYESRPLACKAYPVIAETRKNLELDCKCSFSCRYGVSSAHKSMKSELAALTEIKKLVVPNKDSRIWRYATCVGEKKDKNSLLPEGWYLQDSEGLPMWSTHDDGR
ncbi:MAG: YkgJ family cysteine cluster protein [Thermoproteota archaeon]|nr:YkgJ family cysteine cluster protein [Thermoproteota archaeon]